MYTLLVNNVPLPYSAYSPYSDKDIVKCEIIINNA